MRFDILKNPLLGLLGWMWAFPLTVIVFFAYIFPARLLGQIKLKHRYGFVVECVTVPGSWWDLTLHDMNHGAHSLGAFIVYRYIHHKNPVLTAHERQHSRQVFFFGVLQPVLYVVFGVFVLFVTRRHPYWYNPFEIDARLASGEDLEVASWKEESRYF